MPEQVEDETTVNESYSVTCPQRCVDKRVSRPATRSDGPSARTGTVPERRIDPPPRDMKGNYSSAEPTTTMSHYEASFEIDSKTDSYAARRLLEQVYDTIREESRSVREGTDDAGELLGEFQTLRDAAKRQTPGRLTITYEQYDGEFGD